ncbi:FG-GAP repeat protein, partial [Vibrio crassostreae]|uniref:FG-GAP repeat protein n=1 Tax=Vibrio crassostreae TaxID=246167 RepID=UPI001B304E13
AFPSDATETLDTDGDGVGDNADAFPSDATETLDTDSDGVGDNADAFPTDATETLDTDGDGVGDNADAFPSDATETLDTDGDGVGDNADAFPSDATETLDTDGDGVGDNADVFPSDATETLDTDGDGVGDNADVLDSFNLLSIEASAGATKTAVFTWVSASSEESGITYTVCKKDIVQDNNCDILTSVVDGYSTAILLGNLYKAAGAEYFILASKDSQLQLSNEVSIDNTKLNAMIGFLKASSPEASAQFGHTVVLSSDGDTLAVGAPSENSDGVAGSGAVYIYSQAAGVWSLSQRLDASYDNPSSNTSSRIKSSALFGSSLSLSGDGKVLAVGANAEGDSGSRYGAAYVYSESSSDWSLNQRLEAEAVNLENYAYFGQSVSLTEDGKWLAVGAYKEDNAATNSGAAYVFSESGGVWTRSQHLSPSEPWGANYFGSSVSFSGDGSTLAVGAYGETVDSKSQAGAVYVFSTSDYTTSQRLDAGENAESSAHLGRRVVSLSENGKTLAVGADSEDSNGLDAGAVYVFSESDWSSPWRIVASNGEKNDSFGYSVSLSGDGDTLVVGAYRDEVVK